MSSEINGKGYALKDIFSSYFEYVIPNYQRPYAWTEEQASELFDDLFDFYNSGSAESTKEYFLGSIVLIKQKSKPRSEVIDGQQRLTTLTILLSALASKLEGEDRNTLYYEYIQEPGNKFEGLEPKPRLTLRPRDKKFFSEYVQELKFEQLISIDNKRLANEAQINIKNNSQLLLDRINKNFEDSAEKITKFAQFLVEQCFLVSVSTPNQQSAFRVFSIMNSRGLDLQLTDIIKAEVIGKIAEEKQEEYTERWEDMEVELGRDGFNDLFTYIRMIYAKEKAKKSILDEFKDLDVFKVYLTERPEEFISKELEPYANALSTIRSASYKADSYAEEINLYLRWLNRINDSYWIPVAILFLSVNKNKPEYVKWFFSRLERLAAFMHICALNINNRIKRYIDVIKALEQDHSINLPVQAVELTETEKKEMCAVLESDIYGLTASRRNYLMLRLDSFLSDGGASYNTKNLTVEHVLPQTVNANTEWAQWWPDESQWEKWVHRIANLVLLNRRRNSGAQNFDFSTKKSKYFSGKRDVSSFAITTQVLNMSEWRPENVENRQSELLEVLQENWRL